MSNYTASSVNDISKFLHEAFILRERQIYIEAVSWCINKLVFNSIQFKSLFPS